MPKVNKSKVQLIAPPPPSLAQEENQSQLNARNEQIDPVVEEVSHLPPYIVTNPRRTIEPEHITEGRLLFRSEKRKKKEEKQIFAKIWLSTDVQKEPIPKHPIFLSWWPKDLRFQLDQKPVEKRLFILNRSPKIMYIHVCGLWNDTARLGASWMCYSRTRILLAPGLVGEIYIRAKPKEDPAVPFAYAGLQIAAAHRKDTVVGYFVIPIMVSFLNYVAPLITCEGQEEEIED